MSYQNLKYESRNLELSRDRTKNSTRYSFEIARRNQLDVRDGEYEKKFLFLAIFLLRSDDFAQINKRMPREASKKQ